MENSIEKQSPKVDIVIPVYKPDKKYDKLMERLGKQTVKPNHIYIINTIPEQGDKIDVGLKYQSMDNITVINIPQKEFDHGGTRNMGIGMSDAEFVMLLTQDAVPADKQLIEKMVEPFKNPEVAVSYGRQLATDEVGMIEAYTRRFNYPEESSIKSIKDLKRLGIKTYFCSDVCAMYRRNVHKELGGFETQTIFNEDMIFASKVIKAGYSIAYAANAKVYHAHKYTCKQQFQRNFDMGVSQRQYHQIFDEVKSETEGIALVKKTAGYLWDKGCLWKIFELVLQSGCKFLGYRFGKMYDKLPMWFVKMCSMQKSYWKKERSNL